MLNLLFFVMLRPARDTNQEKCVKAHKVFVDSAREKGHRSGALWKPSYHGLKPTDMTFLGLFEFVVSQGGFHL